MSVNLRIQEPTKRIIKFLEKPNCDTLFEDIQAVCYDLVLNIKKLDDQRNCVLNLDERIKRLLEYLRSSVDSFRSNNLLNKFQYFILITNRTIDGFSLEIQITIDEREYLICLNSK